MIQNSRAPHLIYVADPMCSWCYAFGPELDAVLASTQLPIRLVMGGLFTGDRTLPLDDDLRRYLRDTWDRVSESSGRPVSFDPLEWEGWTYDTERSCTAVIAARTIDGGLALPMFDRIQRAFYTEARDVADGDELAALSVDIGIEQTVFEAAYESAVGSMTNVDFDEAKDLGAIGFPMLVLDTGEEHVTVAAGYMRAPRIVRTIDVFVG